LTMNAWRDAGYFDETVEFRHVGDVDDAWTRVADFL